MTERDEAELRAWCALHSLRRLRALCREAQVPRDEKKEALQAFGRGLVTLQRWAHARGRTMPWEGARS